MIKITTLSATTVEKMGTRHTTDSKWNNNDEYDE